MNVVENRVRLRTARVSRGGVGWSGFLVGAAAGALVAGVATIAAVRQPAVQLWLGLVVEGPPLLVARRPELCPPAAPAARPAPAAETDRSSADTLFSKRRFWSVTP